MRIAAISGTNNLNEKSRVGSSRSTVWSSVRLEQGAQIVRLPLHSTLKNLILRGGASFNSAWAGLRGAAVKFDPKRTNSVSIDGQGFVVPSGHTLMDRGNFIITQGRNSGRMPPHQLIRGLASEDLYLTHNGYCHPGELFLPQGTYTRTELLLDHKLFSGHGRLLEDVLYLREEEIRPTGKSFNLIEQIEPKPRYIIVELKEGGFLKLSA